MRVAQFNNLYFYFVCSQLLFLPVYFYTTPLIPVTISTDKAIWMHLIGLFWSAVGYFTAKYACVLREMQQGRLIKDKRYFFTNTFYMCSYLLLMAGTIIAILQVILFVPLMEYISQLFGSDFEDDVRLAYLLTSDEGGLPGIIKMFAAAPLSVYLMSLGLLSFMKLDKVDRQRLKALSLVALAAIVIKVFFSLDRLTIMAVLLANIFIGFKKGTMRSIRYWILIAVIFLLANYLSLKRLENAGIFDFIFLYFKLGLVNFQLMIDTCSQYTYGFSTILGPLLFVFKFFHISSPDLGDNYEWEWNSAQYFSSYAFQDFGYFYFVSFYIVGFLLCILSVRASKKNIYSSAIYFVVLYGVVSFVFVPAIRGVEFWLTLLIPLVLLSRFAKVHNR